MKVKYVHAALPPIGIEVGKVYEAVEKDDKFIVEEIEFDKDVFVQLFKTIDEENN